MEKQVYLGEGRGQTAANWELPSLRCTRQIWSEFGQARQSRQITASTSFVEGGMIAINGGGPPTAVRAVLCYGQRQRSTG